MSMNLKTIFATFVAVMLTSGAIADTATDSKTLTTVSYVTGALDGKQEKLSGTDGYAVIYDTNGAPNDEREILNSTTAFNNAAADSDALVQTGVVYSKVNEKQPEIVAGANTAVTYGSTAGAVGSKGIYQSSGAYTTGTTGTANNLAQADHVNGAVQNAMKAHLSCYQCTSGAADSCAPANCLLWTMNNTLNGTYVPHQ